MDNRLEFSADIQEEVFPFYAGLDLGISARKWCHLCSLLWRCLDEDSWKRLRIGNAEDPLVSQRVKFQVLVGRPSTVIRIGLVCAEPDAAALAYLGPGEVKASLWSCPTVLFAFDSNDKDPLYFPPSPWHLCSSTRSEAVLGLARHWLERCLTTHSNCSVSSAEDGDGLAIPTRLLDFRGDDEIVFLYISSSHGLKKLDYLLLPQALKARKMNVTVDGFGRMRFENFLVTPGQDTRLFLLEEAFWIRMIMRIIRPISIWS
jgi:hypothetical protein